MLRLSSDGYIQPPSEDEEDDEDDCTLLEEKKKGAGRDLRRLCTAVRLFQVTLGTELKARFLLKQTKKKEAKQSKAKQSNSRNERCARAEVVYLPSPIHQMALMVSNGRAAIRACYPRSDL